VPVAVLAASVAVAGSVLLVAGRAWHAATRPVVRGAGDEVGRMPRAAVAGGVVLVAVAAAVSLWQFRLYGSPLVPSASGGLEVDVVAVLAPVLVLLALSLAALGLARPIGRAPRARGRPGVAGWCPRCRCASWRGAPASTRRHRSWPCSGSPDSRSPPCSPARGTRSTTRWPRCTPAATCA
jgi:hypothetical protein